MGVTASQPTPLLYNPLRVLATFWKVSCDSCDSSDKPLIPMGWKRHNCTNCHNDGALESYTMSNRRFKGLSGRLVRWVVGRGQSSLLAVRWRSVGGFGR